MIWALALPLGCVDLFSSDFAILERCLPTVTTLRPANTSTGVPLDARLLGVLDMADADCEDPSVQFELSLDGEVLEVSAGRADTAAGVVGFEPDEILDPETTYDLFVEDFFTGLEFDIAFTTGTEAADEYTLPPSVIIDGITFEDGDRSSDEYLWSAALTVDHEPSDRELSLVHLSGGESIARDLGAFFASADGVTTTTVGFTTLESDGEVCFAATQQDEAGRGGDSSDVVCKTLPEVSLSCSSAGGRAAAPGWFAVFLLALGRRRC